MSVSKYNPIRDAFKESGFTSDSTTTGAFAESTGLRSDAQNSYTPSSSINLRPYCVSKMSSKRPTKCGATYCNNTYGGNCGHRSYKPDSYQYVDLSELTVTNLNRFAVCFSSSELIEHISHPYSETAAVKNVHYNGDSGQLIESGYMSFDQLGSGQVRVGDTLESYDAFTIEFSYRSTGEHVGAIESLFGVSLDHAYNHGLSIYITNKDGGLGIDLNSDTNLIFDQLNLNDGKEHTIVLTWDSTDGKVDAYDNHIHVASGYLLKGATIREGTVALLGGEQEHTELRNPENATSNIQIHGCTMAYERVDVQSIIEGIPLAQSSNDLAFDLQVRHGRVVDLANNSFVVVSGDVSVLSNYEFYPSHTFCGNIDLSFELEEGLQYAQINMLQHDK